MDPIPENNSPQKDMQQTFDMTTDDEISLMTKTEERLLDLQKEHFHNVRTLITASAAIASVDLLALQALKEIGLANWFLGSVILLYLSSIIFVLYLTLANNVQVKIIAERNDLVKNIGDMAKGKEFRQLVGLENFSKITAQHFAKMTRGLKSMNWATKMLAFGNILFIIGLLIPIAGLVKSFTL